MFANFVNTNNLSNNPAFPYRFGISPFLVIVVFLIPLFGSADLVLGQPHTVFMIVILGYI